MAYNNHNSGTYLGLCATRRSLIREAIEKNVVFEEDPDGTVPRPATAKEVADFIQGIYDDAVYNLLMVTANAAATERLAAAYGINPGSHMSEIIPLFDTETKKRLPLYPFPSKEKDTDHE